MLTICATAQADFKSRLRWNSSVYEIPTTDVVNPLVGTRLLDHQLTYRGVLEWDLGPWDLLIDPYMAINNGESLVVAEAFGSPDQSRDNPDVTKRFRLAKVLDQGGDTRTVLGFDRFALRYRVASTSLTIGRQAVTWGSGFVFNPLDLFSPYAPTTVDREYKTGADLLQLEKLFDAGELQALYIMRQDSVRSSADVLTGAIKWHALVGDLEYELLVGQHFEERVFGAMFRRSLVGSLVRVDLLNTCDDDDCVLSGLVNIDRAFTVGRLPIYAFVELFHNGYGVDDLNQDVVSDSLFERIQRGELFTLMRDYAAFGINTVWHAQWTQSVSLIGNVDDGSALFQTFFTFDPNDSARVQFGVVVPFGTTNGEFGARELPNNMTTGGGVNAFLSVAYYP